MSTRPDQSPEAARPPFAAPSPRRGISLLEVLVASGILMIGLASLAALLPAAASLMVDAARLDRAGNLAINAVADLRFRNLLRADSFTASVKTLVFGSMFPDAPFASNPFRKQSVTPTSLDQQAYGTAWFGATVAPLAGGGTVKKGMTAKVTVVVFSQQAPEVRAIRLRAYPPNQSTPTGIFTIEDTAATVGQLRSSVPSPTEVERRRFEGDRKRFLPGCTWVPVVANNDVRWLQVGNSWATYNKSGQTRDDKRPQQCFVSFSDPDVAKAASVGDLLTINAFNGVLTLHERLVSLD